MSPARKRNGKTSQRRLATIMFTDLVGYSALIQRDEMLALDLLEEQRRLLRPLFSEHGGHEIKTMGDAFLVEFLSALNAVRCAVDMQKRLVEHNASTAPERRQHIRIGLHLGDVEHFEDDVYGDGVNIASRIEPLAEPGGICISEDVARQIENKIDEPILKLGRGELKNIDLPVAVYRIVLPWESWRPALPQRLLFSLRRGTEKVRLVLELLLFILLAMIWLQENRSVSPTVAVDRPHPDSSQTVPAEPVEAVQPVPAPSSVTAPSQPRPVSAEPTRSPVRARQAPPPSVQKIPKADTPKSPTELTKIDIEPAPAEVQPRAVQIPASPLERNRQLIEGAKAGQVERVRALLSAGAKVDATDEEEVTATMWAARGRHTGTLQVLSDAGADVNARDTQRRTALLEAAATGDGEAVRILLKRGAKVNEKDRGGRTALMEAANGGFTYVAADLLAQGAKVNEKESRGLLIRALNSLRGQSRAGANSGSTALMMAAEQGHTDTFKYLLERGADVDAKNRQDCTALMLAARAGHTEIVQILLKNRVRANAADREGRTALMMAATEGRMEVVRALLHVPGLIVNARDKKNRTALMGARQNAHQQIVEMLKQAGAQE